MKTKAQLIKELKLLQTKIDQTNDELENYEITQLRSNKTVSSLLKEIDELPLEYSRTIKLEVTFTKKYNDLADFLDGEFHITTTVKNIEGLSKAEVKAIERYTSDYSDEFCILNKLGDESRKKYNTISQKLYKISGYDNIEDLKEAIES